MNFLWSLSTAALASILVSGIAMAFLPDKLTPFQEALGRMLSISAAAFAFNITNPGCISAMGIVAILSFVSLWWTIREYREYRKLEESK